MNNSSCVTFCQQCSSYCCPFVNEPFINDNVGVAGYHQKWHKINSANIVASWPFGSRLVARTMLAHKVHKAMQLLATHFALIVIKWAAPPRMVRCHEMTFFPLDPFFRSIFLNCSCLMHSVAHFMLLIEWHGTKAVINDPMTMLHDVRKLLRPPSALPAAKWRLKG